MDRPLVRFLFFLLFLIFNEKFRFDVVDARGINELPLKNNNRQWNIFYFIYFTISNLIIFNVLMGIIVEKYFYVKLKESRKYFLLILFLLDF